MAFVRAAEPLAAPQAVASRDEILAQLSSADAAARRHAARALAGDEGAVEALAARLEDEKQASVRDALFAGLVETGGARVARLIAPLLRSHDAGLRNDALEALKQLEGDAVSVVDEMLGDTDPGLRLLAIEVTRAWASLVAVPRLRRIIEDDCHVNVCGAAVDVATEVGTEDLLAPLAALRIRFADEPFLGFAVDVACARIHAARGRAP
jgi:HEAT repeat protein